MAATQPPPRHPRPRARPGHRPPGPHRLVSDQRPRIGRRRYAEVLAEVGAALVLWRRAERTSPAGPGRSRNALACICACGRRIRVARSVLELAPIVGGACAQPFEAEDDGAG